VNVLQKLIKLFPACSYIQLVKEHAYHLKKPQGFQSAPHQVNTIESECHTSLGEVD